MQAVASYKVQKKNNLENPLNPLIAEKLAVFGEELANACESLVSDREARLLSENQRLIAENSALRRELELQKTGLNLRELSDLVEGATGVDCSPCIPIANVDGAITSQSRSSEKSLVPTRSVSSTSTSSVDRETFELLHELCTDIAPHEEILIKEIGNEEIEKSDAGFASMLHHLEMEIVKMSHGRCPVISPSAGHRLAWDVLGIPILAWDLITIPLSVFDPALPEFAHWVTLTYWTLDIPGTFMTGIYNVDGQEVYDHKAIARKCVRGFFFLDFGMIAADWTQVLIGLFNDGEGPSFLKNVALLRIMRISRFARLLRLNKLKDKLHSLEDCLQSEWYLHILDMTIQILKIVAVNHYLGCVWYAIGTASSLGEPEERWVTTYKSSQGILVDCSFWYRYTTSLHWAISMLTPGGTNIEPANPYERLYNIFVLLFCLVIFSSFVASVTQARIAMAKVMGKFERQHWILREYCRQHHISSQLRREMKRYIDIVVAPSQWKLKLNEVELVKKLSPNLQQRLNSEIFSDKIVVHPFFAHVRERYNSLMNSVCTNVLETMPLAKKDVAFSGGQKAQFMLIMDSGRCDYILLKHPTSHIVVSKGNWVSEAAFWTKWIHLGQLQASHDTMTTCVDAAKFRAAVIRSAVCMRLVRDYGSAFCQSLNVLVRRKENLTDLHDFASSYFVPSRKSIGEANEEEDLPKVAV